LTRYTTRPLDLTKLRTVPLQKRGGKVRTEQFAKPHEQGSGFGGFLDSLPRILAAESLRGVVRALESARTRRRGIIWALGGHVIKCGLAPVLLDLAHRGYATAFALNGAAAIHDFEIALAGHTSEDVETVLPDGSFGAAEETGRELNRAFIEARRDGIGGGEAICRAAAGQTRADLASASLLAGAWSTSTPVTIHIAVGTDTPHTHPLADAESIGFATLTDFRLLCALLRDIHDGGVFLNVGSAVVLPEVFLKAVSAVRNLGYPLSHFTTVNLDFLQHYRPRVNVVERPHAGSGGQGFSLTGHHEIMIPLLAAILIERPS
jgi:hypothetical protein